MNLSTKGEVAEIMVSVFDIIKETVQHEGRIMISGSLGILAIRTKKVRPGRNPKTGGTTEIRRRRVLTFEPRKCLRPVLAVPSERMR